MMTERPIIRLKKRIQVKSLAQPTLPDDMTEIEKSVNCLKKADYMEWRDFFEALACDKHFYDLLSRETRNVLNGTHPDTLYVGMRLLEISTKYWKKRGYDEN